MKKYIFIFIAVLLLVVLLLAGFFLNPWRVSVDPARGAVARFSYVDTEVNTALETADSTALAEIFNGKWVFPDSPSCGFGEDVSVRIDDLTFCIACDTCPVIYVKEKDCYMHLSKEEIETVHTILESYGFVFPCI